MFQVTHVTGIFKFISIVLFSNAIFLHIYGCFSFSFLIICICSLYLFTFIFKPNKTFIVSILLWFLYLGFYSSILVSFLKNDCFYALFLVIGNYKTMKFSLVSFAHVQNNADTLCSSFSCFKIVSNYNIDFIVGPRFRDFKLWNDRWFFLSFKLY